MVDDKAYSREKGEGRCQMREAFLLGRVEDVEDGMNLPRVEKSLQRLRHQRENERGQAKAEWENYVFIKAASLTEAKDATEAAIDGDVEVCVLQVD